MRLSPAEVTDEANNSDNKLLISIRKAEFVLQHRTDRILLVLERCTDNQNYLACLRTADCLGIQNVWIVHHEPPAAKRSAEEAAEHLKKKGRIARQAGQWMDVRAYDTTTDCIAALRGEGYTIWATDLSKAACRLDEPGLELPPKLAIVMGREADGVSEEMLLAADRRVYLPMFGFNECVNLSVATALVLQHLLHMCPAARGDMSSGRRDQLRREWYSKLARSEGQQQQVAAYLAQPPPPLADMRQ